VLSKIFGSKREEVREERRKLYNSSFMIFLLTNYFLGDQIKMRWAVHVAFMQEKRYTYRVLM
jgi:hypothetical protein